MQLVNLSRVALNHRGISNMQFSCKLQIQIRTTCYRCSNEARQGEPCCDSLSEEEGEMPPQKSTDAQQWQTDTHTHIASHTYTLQRECEIMCATASDTPCRVRRGSSSVWAVPRLIYDRKHVIGATTVETRKQQHPSLASPLHHVPLPL